MSYQTLDRRKAEPRRGRLGRSLGAAILLVVLACMPLVSAVPAAAASSPAYYNNAIEQTWARTDQPVTLDLVDRTWMWGPRPDHPAMLEAYAESPGGQRVVQYFDKSRMEITHPNGDQSSQWYVTNGLLAEELITGKMQLGDNTFKQYAPAQVNVAGDPNDANGPTYATFNPLMQYKAIPSGWLVTQTVNRSGKVGSDPSLKSQNVTAKAVGSPTTHTVASVFWDFMNSSGTVWQNGKTAQAKLFSNPFYATGYPLTEPYWATVKVGGKSKLVLIQVFERRVLTYTPSNPAGWKVESGNVGQHYYTWRYQQLSLPIQVAPAAPPSQQAKPPTRDVDCVDFANQPAAQAWFNQHGGSPSNNVSDLDADHNGIACESLPGAPSQTVKPPSNPTPPPPPPTSSHPANTTGRCNDGSYTDAQHSQGACSHHGGLASYWGP